MSWKEEDRRIIIAAAEELQSYLLSQQLFWGIANQSVRLSCGRLLLAQKRKVVNETFLSSNEAQAADEKVGEIIAKWRATWERKILIEIPTRIRLWKNSVDEVFEEGVVDQLFNTQVKDRVILELLINDLNRSDYKDLLALKKVDDSLKRQTVSGNFLWDPSMKEIFDQKIYWFLYVQSGEVNK